MSNYYRDETTDEPREMEPMRWWEIVLWMGLFLLPAFLVV